MAILKFGLLALSAVLVAVAGIAATSRGEEPSGKTDYYEKLCQLVSSRRRPPAPASSQALVIDPQSAVAGVRRGASCRDIVKVWGKPNRINMYYDGVLDLCYYGGMVFSLQGNKLFRVNVQGIEGARTVGGLALGSTTEVVRRVMGKATIVDESAAGLDWTYKSRGHRLGVVFFAGKVACIRIEWE